jgi:rhomboid protease GluP
MILRWLAREFRDFPATSSICLAWVVIFAGMTYHQWNWVPSVTPVGWLVLGFGGGESFGDLTLNDLSRGQFWRLITCNFVHYSLIHVVLNVLSMYVLGGFLESWYGSYQLVFLYGLMGGGGNLLSSLVRHWLRSNGAVHSAGASVAIMGMIGLCAVVGLRSTTEEGKRLARWMMFFIATTAALGLIFPSHIDNLGHASGLVVGVALGFAHRRLCARVGTPYAWGAGVLTALIMIGCGANQFAVDRREAPARLKVALERRSSYVTRAKGELIWLRRPDPPPRLLDDASKWLDVLEQWLDRPARTEIQALRPLVRGAQSQPLNEPDRQALAEHLGRLLDAMQRQYEDDRRRLAQLRNVR